MARKTTHFILQVPNKKHGRKSFGLLRRNPEGKSEKVKSAEIDAINSKYQRGIIDFDSAHAKMKDLREKAYKAIKPKRSLCKANLDLLEDYYEKYYRYKDIKAHRAAWNRLQRAVEAVGELSLLTADRFELQKAIADHPDQRRMAAALNQLLMFLGRADIKIMLNKKKRIEVKYLTVKEFKRVLLHLDAPDKELMKLLCTAAYATGARLGECFAMEEARLQHKGKSVFIGNQLRMDGEPDETKTGKPRVAMILKEFREQVREWAELDTDEKLEARKWGHAKIFKEACQKAFPKNLQKHLTFRDIRHCYAVHLSNEGLSIATIAEFMGNSEQVCEEYYKGFNSKKETILGAIQITG